MISIFTRVVGLVIVLVVFQSTTTFGMPKLGSVAFLGGGRPPVRERLWIETKSLLPLSRTQAKPSSLYSLSSDSSSGSSSSSSDDDQVEVDAWTRFASEDTLMNLHIRVVDSTCDVKIIMQEIQKFTKKFPFSAILPVQPLQYTPTDDGGVEILFLRKKTKEKGSIDGGLRFFVRRVQEEEDEEEEGSSSYPMIEIVVKRNSEGQAISKVFSEKLLILAYLDGILANNGGSPKYGDPSAFLEKVSVESVFHKWMEL